MDMLDKLKKRLDREIKRTGGWAISIEAPVSNDPKFPWRVTIPARDSPINGEKYYASFERVLSLKSPIFFEYKIRAQDKARLLAGLVMVNNQLHVYAQFCVPRKFDDHDQGYYLHRYIKNLEDPTSLGGLYKFSKKAKRESSSSFGSSALQFSANDVQEGRVVIIDH